MGDNMSLVSKEQRDRWVELQERWRNEELSEHEMATAENELIAVAFPVLIEHIGYLEDVRKPYRYDEARKMLKQIIDDFCVLSGDKVGPSCSSWQDVAGTVMTNLHVLSKRVQAAREGRVVDGPVVFPSPNDL